MRSFEFAAPKTIDQAVALLGDGNDNGPRRRAPLSGGTDLLALMKDDVVAPGRLVDLKGIGELRGVTPTEGGLRIGALEALDDLAENPDLRRISPAVADSVALVGAPQIRSRGTLGGNLCQRPRCWYFRKGYGLLAVEKGRSMVVDGDNRFHAILGTDGPAYFVSPSTVLPVLVALGATVETAGPTGRRTRPVQELYRVPTSPDEGELVLEQGEIVTAVEVPATGDRSVASYEVRPGEALDWSLATAAVSLRREGGTVTEATVVLGQVAPIPWRAREAEAALVGHSLTPEVTARAADAAVAAATPLSMNAYKVQLARVAVRRALERIGG